MRRPLRRGVASASAVAVALCAVDCASAPGVRVLEVTATAYNSVAGQTNANPTQTAWGDHLRPGMKAIAVSRDLLALGLTHGVRVEIDGLDGLYTVRDKMARRWKKKIDIYMGEDVEAARRFGRQSVTIRFRPSAAAER